MWRKSFNISRPITYIRFPNQSESIILTTVEGRERQVYYCIVWDQVMPPSREHSISFHWNIRLILMMRMMIRGRNLSEKDIFSCLKRRGKTSILHFFLSTDMITGEELIRRFCPTLLHIHAGDIRTSLRSIYVLTVHQCTLFHSPHHHLTSLIFSGKNQMGSLWVEKISWANLWLLLLLLELRTQEDMRMFPLPISILEFLSRERELYGFLC